MGISKRLSEDTERRYLLDIIEQEEKPVRKPNTCRFCGKTYMDCKCWTEKEYEKSVVPSYE